MKKVCLMLLCFVLGTILADTASARGRWRRSRTTYSATVSSGGTSAMYSGTDQDRAYAEAKYMHENGIRRHVGSLIGNFEGWGYGGPNCATCTPRGGMTLTGDAHYGSIRVRSWR